MEKIKTGVGHANGKIILIGEHSVVYGTCHRLSITFRAT